MAQVPTHSSVGERKHEYEHLAALAAQIEGAPRTSAGRTRVLNRLSSLGKATREERIVIAQALETWAEEAVSDDDAALVWVRAGDLVSADSSETARAAQYYVRALEREPFHLPALERLTTRLQEAGKHELIEALWQRYVDSVCQAERFGSAHKALAWRRLARVRANVLGHLDLAIAAYERALAERYDERCVAELAEVHARRGSPHDLDTASELFEQIGEPLGEDSIIVAADYAREVRQDRSEEGQRSSSTALERIDPSTHHAVTVVASEPPRAIQALPADTSSAPQPRLLQAPTSSAADSGSARTTPASTDADVPSAASVDAADRAAQPQAPPNENVAASPARKPKGVDRNPTPRIPLAAARVPKSLPRWSVMLAAAACIAAGVLGSQVVRPMFAQTAVAEASRATPAQTPVTAVQAKQTAGSEQGPAQAPQAEAPGSRAVGDTHPAPAAPAAEAPAEPSPAAEETEPSREAAEVRVIHHLTSVRRARIPRPRIRKALTAAADKLEQCSLEARPNKRLRGRLVFYMALRPDGRVAQVDPPRGSLRDPAVRACAVDAMQNMRFPDTRGGRALIRGVFQFKG